MNLCEFLENSYTAYNAVENAASALTAAGFTALNENEAWNLKEGGKYFVTRGGSSIVAFRYASGAYKIVASHTDSPCLKLKENAALSDDKFTRLNTEPYGGGLWYSFFDRPLKIAGRVVKEKDGALVAENFVSDFCVVLPSLAIHMNREANEKFAPNLQTELPLLALGKAEFKAIVEGAVSYDLYAVPAEKCFVSGLNGEFLSAPRLDNLSSVCASISALMEGGRGCCIAACFDSEEVGSRTRQGAGSDLLRATLTRIAHAQGANEEEFLQKLASSFLISLDNAHSLHPSHPEKCDPTNRAMMGGGVVIKAHAGGAYTSDALTSAIIKKIFTDADVKFQTFFNRSDMRSGSTLGAISLTQVSVPSVDLGLAQLAMHSAVETMAKADYDELEKGLKAFYGSEMRFVGDTVCIS